MSFSHRVVPKGPDAKRRSWAGPTCTASFAYRISPVKSLWGSIKHIRVTIRAGRQPITLPALCVVAKSRTIPLSLDQGTVIASFPGGHMIRPGQDIELSFPFEQWPKDTLAGLFVSDHGESECLTLVPETPRMDIGQ